MTANLVCPTCGGLFHAYEQGDGRLLGTCYNCGKTHAYGYVDVKREQELLENHLRGAGRCRRQS